MEKVFCRKCGSALGKWGFVPEKGYSEVTGKKIEVQFFDYRCPKKKWYNWHDHRYLSEGLELL